MQAVDQMQLVAVGIALNVVAQQGLVSKAEGTTLLLADRDALTDGSGAVALGEGIRIRVRLDGAGELLGRHQGQVLLVVCIQSRGLSTRRALGHAGQAVPSLTSRIGAVIGLGIDSPLLDTGFVKALAGLIPDETTANSISHGDYLLVIDSE